MSKAKRREREEARGGKRRRSGFLFLAAAAALILIAVGFALTGRGAFQAVRHPEPRANAEAVETVSPARYAGYPRIHRVYAMAEGVKGTLDGLYCYCRCKEHSDHRSLLTCFQSDHGAGCDVCLDQAALAYRMQRQGASLDEIRQETDRQFGRGS